MSSSGQQEAHMIKGMMILLSFCQRITIREYSTGLEVFQINKVYGSPKDEAQE